MHVSMLQSVWATQSRHKTQSVAPDGESETTYTHYLVLGTLASPGDGRSMLGARTHEPRTRPTVSLLVVGRFALTPTAPLLVTGTGVGLVCTAVDTLRGQ